MLSEVYHILQILETAEKLLELNRPWAQFYNPEKVHYQEGGGLTVHDGKSRAVGISMDQLVSILKLVSQLYGTIPALRMILTRLFAETSMSPLEHPEFDRVLEELAAHHMPVTTRQQPKSTTLVAMHRARETGRVMIARPRLSDIKLPPPSVEHMEVMGALEHLQSVVNTGPRSELAGLIYTELFEYVQQPERFCGQSLRVQLPEWVGVHIGRQLGGAPPATIQGLDVVYSSDIPDPRVIAEDGRWTVLEKTQSALENIQASKPS